MKGRPENDEVEAALRRMPVLERTDLDGYSLRPCDSGHSRIWLNEDVDRPGAVAAADRLRAEVQSADALLLVTPEYNGTMSAALKNAIDWISRPFGAGAITGKPVAVIGTSHGQYGGVWARTTTRASQHASREEMCSMTSS
jgi:NAD(P)H-dependent FMN reductase